MRASEREAVLDLLEGAFDLRTLFARYMDHDPLFGPGDFLLALDGTRPVSCVQIFDKRIYLFGREVHLGGIGSVATHPDFRGRGLASELLKRSEPRMRDRGMPLALLFTGITRFYSKLGWIRAFMDLNSYRRGAAFRGPANDLSTRRFDDADLAEVMAIYDQDNANRPGSTIRNESYWHGQLRYAGAEGEDFRVVERDGRIVAYARHLQMAACQIMEHASMPGELDSLAALIASMTQGRRRLLIRSPAPALDAALIELGLEVERHRDPAPMWRVLDLPALQDLAGIEGDDEALIDVLVRQPGTHFWLSDRF
ncbi:MAG: GNAT family N-acetyltransferase [Acidobacteriota bacterium]|nr:GNAT family N-acetyltransferase [Acidobacteriota bacterium]